MNCASRVKQITQLSSSEQTGTGRDELAVPRNFIIALYIISFLCMLYYDLCTCAVVTICAMVEVLFLFCTYLLCLLGVLPLTTCEVHCSVSA